MEYTNAEQSYFIANTPVATDRGQKPIEDIRLGDMVLTHMGRYRKVIGTRAAYVSSLVSLSGIGASEIICSEGQRFLMSKMSVGLAASEPPDWIASGNACLHSWLNAFPDIDDVVHEPHVMDSQSSHGYMEENIDIAYIVGYWLMSGIYIDSDEVCEDDSIYIDDVGEDTLETLISHLVALDMFHELSADTVDDKKHMGIRIISPALNAFIKDEFIAPDWRRVIPNWVYATPSSFRLSMLKGTMDHMKTYDNILADDSLYPDKALPVRCMSQNLDSEIKMLGASLGITVRTYPNGNDEPIMAFLPTSPLSADSTLPGWWGEICEMRKNEYAFPIEAYGLRVEEDGSYIACGVAAEGR